MKKVKIVSLFVFLTTIVACSPENDIKNPDFTPLIYGEEFSMGTVDNTVLDTPNWINIAQTGTAKWKEQEYSGNGYAEFSAYQSGEAVNVGWLISPAINLDKQDNEKLRFQASQSYVTSGANSLEVFISNDFDGTNVATATWIPLECTLPTTSSTYFAFIDSGAIDLSSFTGNCRIAFKVKGSGTNTALDGSYQIDNIRIYN